jgi:hypothetical protein
MITYRIPPHRKRPKWNLFHLRPLVIDTPERGAIELSYCIIVGDGWLYNDRGQGRLNKFIGWQIGLPNYGADYYGDRRFIHDNSVRLALKPNGELYLWMYPDSDVGVAYPLGITVEQWDSIDISFQFARRGSGASFVNVQHTGKDALDTTVRHIPLPHVLRSPLVFMYELGPYIDVEPRPNEEASLFIKKWPCRYIS